MEGAILQVSPGNEAHLHAFATDLVDAGLASQRRYLHTSPEFSLQEASGGRRDNASSISPACSAIASVPRPIIPNSPCSNGTGHNEPYDVLMDDCADMLRARRRRSGGATASRFAGLRPIRTPSPSGSRGRGVPAPCRHRPPRDDRRATASDGSGCAGRGRPERRGCASPRTTDGRDIYSGILVERIEPRLGDGRATILYDYPARRGGVVAAHAP